MSFASKANYGARTFSQIIIDLMSRFERPNHHTRVSNLVRRGSCVGTILLLT